LETELAKMNSKIDQLSSKNVELKNQTGALEQKCSSIKEKFVRHKSQIKKQRSEHKWKPFVVMPCFGTDVNDSRTLIVLAFFEYQSQMFDNLADRFEVCVKVFSNVLIPPDHKRPNL
jgi:hypothetical protein